MEDPCPQVVSTYPIRHTRHIIPWFGRQYETQSSQTHSKDEECWDIDKAKELYVDWFGERANKIAKEGLPVPAAWYADRLTGQSTYRGFLESIEDAIYLLEACLQGKLVHLCRGIRDGEAAISGNVFVWEANSTGMARRRDRTEWIIREKDGFEVGEATNGSGPMKKSASIPACGAIHHMVCYYTERNTRTLARPSRSMTLRPGLSSVLAASVPFWNV